MFFDDVASRDTLSRAVKSNRIRRLAPRIYSADLESPPEEILAKNLWPIVGRLVPGAVIVDRTAARGGIGDTGVVHIAADDPRRTISLKGIEIRIRQGTRITSPVEDPPWTAGLWMSSNARILVDNLEITRGRDNRVARTMSLEEIESWLTTKAISWGDTRMARLRDEAMALATAVGAPQKSHQIRHLFGQIEGNASLRPTSSRLLRAYRHGRAWDDTRMTMFNRLAQSLHEYEDRDVPDWLPCGPEGEALPFFESYFSNYIEGTTFTVDEARLIIDTQQLPADRPADGHDILGTYRCVADIVGRRTTSAEADEFLRHLRERHEMIMGGRPELRPGNWKTSSNNVGGYEFVQPDLVEGTLRRAFELVHEVPAGFRRALFVMMLVSEVHPFADGNGRAARVMMNAELSAVRAARIVIPSVYRNEYISSIRRTSTTGAADITALVRVMSFAWRWTAAMPWHDRAAAEGQLTATNALRDPVTTAIGGIKLQLP